MYTDEIIVSENMTVMQAMERLNKSAAKILYVCKDKKLLAAITDGDIRRWILSNGNVNESIMPVANYNPKYLIGGTYEEAVAYMKTYVIESVPIVNKYMEIEKICFLSIKKEKYSEALEIPVVIMAGGEGKRLYPYTNILPKPLIPIGELPILERVIQQFHHYGCNDYYVIVNHKRNMIKAYFNEIEQPYRLNFVDELIPLGTGGGLSLLKGKVNDTFVLSNCDILIEEDMSKIYEYHKMSKNVITMICAKKKIVIPYGIVEISNENQILDMKEKPELSFLTNTGCYVVEKAVLDLIEDETYISFPEIVELCQRNGHRVGIYEIQEEQWLDMGQLDELEKMKHKLQV